MITPSPPLRKRGRDRGQNVKRDVKCRQNQPLPPHQGLTKMKKMYNLEEGKLECQCLVRKWKFCQKICDLGDGKLGKNLIEAKILENCSHLEHKNGHHRPKNHVFGKKAETDNSSQYWPSGVLFAF